jgi:hypothetical protein
MKNTLRSATPVDQKVTGEPIEAYGYIVTPVARVRGRLGSSSDERSSGRYGWLAIRPLNVIVQDRDGNTREVLIVNMQTQLMLRLVAVGIFVALASVLVPMLSRSRRR